nr:MAG TPA: hypothetical protein [Caudoviricetes sp.]
MTFPLMRRSRQGLTPMRTEIARFTKGSKV